MMPRSPSQVIISDGGRELLLQILPYELPIHEMVEEGLDEIRPAVLEVEIIGMFPDIDRQERGLPRCHRIDRIRRLGDLERGPFLDKPGPAAAELGHRRLLEAVRELVEAAEGLVDALP